LTGAWLRTPPAVWRRKTTEFALAHERVLALLGGLGAEREA
jgi:hypothetical protein